MLRVLNVSEEFKLKKKQTQPCSHKYGKIDLHREFKDDFLHVMYLFATIPLPKDMRQFANIP